MYVRLSFKSNLAINSKQTHNNDKYPGSMQYPLKAPARAPEYFS